MSVNGDMMVVRNGRSTSQVSVYNYPEHLNPFYEDDNHKRLRFWKINKGDKDGQGRRNSFSLGGLKDMWAFKSFRTKKKSSSLGINKTSESPPQMRRDIFTHENGYSTYDPRMRYTTGAGNGLGGGGGNAFQRNVPYRTSLQDMRSEQQTTPINGIGFNRNDRYRSTIQTANTSGTRGSSPSQSLTLPPPRRYVYGGSVTPQPVRNNDFNSDSLGMISRGSSQASVASTNPFDDDEDDDDDVVLGSVSAGSTPSKHPARKKRRAPPPPVPVHQIIKEESSSSGSTPSHKPSTTQDDERVEIHNLTAEIESFVKLSNSDEREHHSSATTTTTTTTTTTDVSKSPKQNGTIPKSSPTRISNGTANAEVDIIITTDTEPLFIREDQDTDVTVKKDSSAEIVEKQAKSPVKEVGHVEVIHVHLESPRSSPEKTEPSRVSTFRSEVKAESPDTNARRNSKEKVVAFKTVEVVQVHKSNVKPAEELKIMESPEKPPIAAKPNIPRSPIPVSPKLAEARLETPYHIETPDTPAMRRREIKIEEDLPSSPEMNHREVGIEVDSVVKPTAKPQEVTIKISRVTTTLNDSVKVKEERSTPDIPVPAVREHRPQTSPLPAVRKVINTDGDGNISTKQESSQVPTVKRTEVDEKISNLDTDVPTTISELQLQISETELNPHRVEEPSTRIPATLAEVSQLPIASTSNTEVAESASIEKPPRAKHFAEEVPENIYRPRPSQWKESTLAPLEPVPPEKRRSVKQIIESINRSQRLLNGKKEDEADIDTDAANSERNMSETNTNAMEQNLKSLAESQREMKRMLEELEGLENVNEHKLSNKNDENFQGILDTIVSTLARETAKTNNADVFKKCTITKEVNNASRESSPTSSNLDWNPVPKPKRTKNRSPELEVKKNNNN